MSTGKTDFSASISITSPSPISKQLQSLLPSNYTRSQSSNVYALMYGTGNELETVKQTIGQTEANNYLYSPSTQTGSISIVGAGQYLIEFDVPFVVPPLNASVSASANTDVFIEYTSRFGMTINVPTESFDVVNWSCSGTIGAATDEYLGDALYNNFGSLLSLPRSGDCIIDDSFVKQYENFNTFVKVSSMIPVLNLDKFPDSIAYNPPPVGALRGQLRPTLAVANPTASHELVDATGHIIALIAFNATGFPLTSTVTELASAFLPVNLQARFGGASNVLPTYDVYVGGSVGTFTYNRWDQISYQQEVFRGDNVYRRLLAGVNRSIRTGPTLGGLADMFETILAQPYIPSDLWDTSDFRVYNNPSFLTYNADPNTNLITSVTSQYQYEGYPTVPPIVEVHEISSQWTPETLTYANRPVLVPLTDTNAVQVSSLNTATTFDITNEVIRQLRVGINAATGGILDWNFLSAITPTVNGHAVVNSTYNSGNVIGGKTFPYNYTFLNNATDSIASVIIFYYQKQYDTDGVTPLGYRTFGPLQYNRDFFTVDTQSLYSATTNGGLGGYDLPAELLNGYNANSNYPALGTNGGLTQGQNYIANSSNATLLPLPSAVLKIDLSQPYYNTGGSKFPKNADDFLIYTYTELVCNPGVVTGSFNKDPNVPSLVDYCDSQSGATIQPSDSPFNNSAVSLAQGSFARFTSESGYNYVATMIGGQITFNKTISVANLLTYSPVETAANTGPAGIVIMKGISVYPTNGTSYAKNGNVFSIEGTIVANTSSNRQPYFQVDNANFVLMGTNGYPVAIFSSDSPLNLAQYLNDPTTRLFTGFVGSVLWDTRIPATEYQDSSPVFQASTNFNAPVIPFTPNVEVPDASLPINQNFLVLINELPLGNEQTVTASWTFRIVQQKSIVLTSSYNTSTPVLSFPDLQNRPGIMTYFTGGTLLRTYSVDPDDATYTQQYISPQFGGYFIGYKDYLATNYGNGVNGGQLSAQGDQNTFDTVYNSNTTPAEKATILTFFNPILGLFSFSVIPGMEFYQVSNNAMVDVIRPRNNGIALMIRRDSYAGLAFYGLTGDKIVDKPTRLLVDFNFSASGMANRHRVVEIEDNTAAGWVNGMDPGNVQDPATFYLAGNQFKYSHTGYDQGANNTAYSLTSTPPSYETTDSQVSASTPDTVSTVMSKGVPGYPQRYRRPPIYVPDHAGHENPDLTYYNLTPEKIAYFKFDLSTFPFDTLVKAAELEVYFCSGFTLREGDKKNMTLSYNQMWNKSRLSGNGRTQDVDVLDVTGNYVLDTNNNKVTVKRPLNNVHWRKNFFEVVIPYAFQSRNDNLLYGIRNPLLDSNFAHDIIEQTPPSELEYLGFINLDEIGVNPLGLGTTLFIESTQGLSNFIVTKETVIRQVFGTLTADDAGNPEVGVYDNAHPNGLPTLAQSASLPSGFRYQQPLQQTQVLPNMKVLVFPFGDNAKTVDGIADVPDPTMPYVYGYVKSYIPSSQIGFDSSNISLYKSLIDYVCPLYAQYNVKLLNSDTYLPFMTFGKTTFVEDTLNDISI